MNRFGLLNNRSPSPTLSFPFSEIEGDSLTDGEISWDDKIQNDIYLHAMLDFVNHGKQQHKKVSNMAPILFNRAVTRPETAPDKKFGLWDAFFPKEKEAPIPSVIYIELHAPLNPQKKQKYVENPSEKEDEERFDSTEELTVCYGSFQDSVITPSLLTEQLTVQTHFEDDSSLMQTLGLRRSGDEEQNWNGSYFANASFFSCDAAMEWVQPFEPVLTDDTLLAQRQWTKDEKSRHRRSVDSLRGNQFLNYGYI